MSVRKRKDGRWEAYVVTKVDGVRERIRKSAATKEQALRLERDIRTKLDRGELRPATKAPLFSEWAKEFLDVYVSANNKPSEQAAKKTIVETHLVPFFGDMRIDQIGRRTIETYKAKQLKTVTRSGEPTSPKTINNRLTVLRRMLSLAHEYEMIPAVPKVKWLKVPQAKFRFFSFEEAELVLDKAEPEWRPMLLVAMRTGLRRGELLALRWEDVDLTHGRIVVNRSVWKGQEGTPKGGRSREVPLSSEAKEALRSLPSRFAKGYVFGDGKTRLTHGEVKHPLWRACVAAGLPKAGWHVCRHTFASHLVMRGVPLKAVQELMGHADIQTTMRYAHLSPDVRTDAVAQLDRRPAPRKEATGS